jgi:hypothetical protein
MSSANLSKLSSRLTSKGYEISGAKFDSREVLVGRHSDFKVQWLLTTLHTFVFAVDFSDEPLDEELLDKYMDVASGYAIKSKGGLPRGLQSGSAAVVVAISANPSAEAQQWASRQRGRRFAATTFPVVLSSTTGKVTHPGPAILGAIYNSHLRKVADDVVGGAF